MYEIDGDYGKVRLAQNVETQVSSTILNYSPSFGWHECNSRYRVARESGAKHYLILMTVSGCGRLKIDSNPYPLTPNTVAIVEPHVKNEYYADRLWQFYWIHPTGNYCKNVLDYILKEKTCVFDVDKIHLLTEKIEHLLMLNLSRRYDYEIQLSVAISEFLHVLISEALRLNSGKSKEKEIVEDMIAFLEDNFKNAVSLKDISSKIFVSNAHMIRVFKSKTGITPYEYLLRYRIMKACELLEFTKLQINQIAKEVGFKSASNFISYFKSIKGITPRSYRNET